MEWISGHMGEIISVLTGVVTVASVIAKITPNQVDNKVAGFMLKFIDLLAMSTKPTEVNK